MQYVLGGSCPSWQLSWVATVRILWYLYVNQQEELYKSETDPLYKELGIEWGFTPFETKEENRLDIKG